MTSAAVARELAKQDIRDCHQLVCVGLAIVGDGIDGIDGIAWEELERRLFFLPVALMDGSSGVFISEQKHRRRSWFLPFSEISDYLDRRSVLDSASASSKGIPIFNFYRRK